MNTWKEQEKAQRYVVPDNFARKTKTMKKFKNEFKILGNSEVLRKTGKKTMGNGSLGDFLKSVYYLLIVL